MDSLTNKRKGMRGEKDIVNLLRESGVDKTAKRDPGSGGGNKEKSDVVNSINYCIEVKRVEKLNIFKAIRQVCGYALMTHAVPAVFFKQNGMDEYWVAIPASEWTRIKRRSRAPKAPSTNRQMYWDLNQLKSVTAKVMKHLRE